MSQVRILPGARSLRPVIPPRLGITVDHFVEVTMAAFYEVATVVQPLTVCVKEDTQDSYSGAQFHAGVQPVDAKQAVAFVRQRRDTKQPDLAFTDLDRSRRQRAFLVALLQKTKSTSRRCGQPSAGCSPGRRRRPYRRRRPAAPRRRARRAPRPRDRARSRRRADGSPADRAHRSAGRRGALREVTGAHSERATSSFMISLVPP
ncbi:LCP family protein [Calidifontibacter indicus]|uniref:LCP family protein n=1 Tax=Calidifontibacter indicus TaxID=419650 RepID=UPI003D71491B